MRRSLILLLAALCCGGMSHAQTASEDPGGGLFTNHGGLYVKGGLNLANVTTTANGAVNNATTRASFNVGFLGDLPLANVLSLQIGAEWTGKGSKAQYNSATYTGIYTFRPYYLEVPVDLVVKLPVGPGAAILIGAGGYGAMGVAGDYITTINSAAGSATTSNTIHWTSSNDVTTGNENGSAPGVLRRYDFGGNFLAGVQAGPVQLTAGYDLGFTKISSTSANNNDNDKNRVFSVNLAFRL